MSEGKAIVHVIREENSNTGQLVVACPSTKKCAIIDPVLNFDLPSATVTTESADKLIDFCEQKGYTIEWSLDTHIHADHLSATHYVKQKTGAKTAIGEHVVEVQKHFQKVFNYSDEDLAGPFWDHMWKADEKFHIGELEVKVLHTPGHTPADSSYYIKDDIVITGDSLFMPDMGTARCDFPGGSVETLWESTQKILSLPKQTRVFVGHDYMPDGREWSVECTVEKELQENKHVKDSMEKEEFIKLRLERDSKLSIPKLLLPSMQFNIRGGRAPPKEKGASASFVKIPLSLPESFNQ